MALKENMENTKKTPAHFIRYKVFITLKSNKKQGHSCDVSHLNTPYRFNIRDVQVNDKSYSTIKYNICTETLHLLFYPFQIRSLYIYIYISLPYI